MKLTNKTLSQKIGRLIIERLASKSVRKIGVASLLSLTVHFSAQAAKEDLSELEFVAHEIADISLQIEEAIKDNAKLQKSFGDYSLKIKDTRKPKNE